MKVTKARVLLVAFVVVAVGLWWWSGRVEREVVAVADETYERAELEGGRRVVLSPDRTKSDSRCRGRSEPYSGHMQRIDWRNVDGDMVEAARRTADSLEADGWLVQRSERSGVRSIGAATVGYSVSVHFSIAPDGDSGSVTVVARKRPADCDLTTPDVGNSAVDAFSEEFAVASTGSASDSLSDSIESAEVDCVQAVDPELTTRYLDVLNAVGTDGETPSFFDDPAALSELEAAVGPAFVGLSESDAERFCSLNSITCEVILRDGQSQFDPTDDLVARRVRLAIADGAVVAASLSG